MAVERELEVARYAADLAERRHEHVDPAKRHVVRTLETRWNAALEKVAAVKQKLGRLGADIRSKPRVDPAVRMQLASDLPFVRNAAGTDARAKQRLVRLLIEEVVIDIDAMMNEFVILLHWIGGRHTEVRLDRRRTGRFPPGEELVAGDVLRKLGGHRPDRELAVTLNRMLCRTEDGETWTTVRIADPRERLAIPPYDSETDIPKTLSVDAAAKRLGICVAAVHKLIRSGARRLSGPSPHPTIAASSPEPPEAPRTRPPPYDAPDGPPMPPPLQISTPGRIVAEGFNRKVRPGQRLH
ncbi:MAG: hypothetical protein ACK4HF_18055 [Paracoccaceae bacterium]